MSLQLDQVGEVRAAVNASPDPKALKARIVGELRQRYPDVVAQARSDSAGAVLDHVLFEHPHIVERGRTQLLVHADTGAPLEAVVSAARAETTACISLTATQS